MAGWLCTPRPPPRGMILPLPDAQHLGAPLPPTPPTPGCPPRTHIAVVNVEDVDFGGRLHLLHPGPIPGGGGGVTVTPNPHLGVGPHHPHGGGGVGGRTPASPFTVDELGDAEVAAARGVGALHRRVAAHLGAHVLHQLLQLGACRGAGS